jgi:hypothetical protein
VPPPVWVKLQPVWLEQEAAEPMLPMKVPEMLQ